MKNILICVKRAKNPSNFGGVITIINSYLNHVQIFREHGYELKLFDYQPKCKIKNSKIDNVVYGIAQCRAIQRYLKENRCDAVHIHTSRQFLYLKDVWLARVIKKKRGVPVYITVHVGKADTVFRRIGAFRGISIRWLNIYVDKVFFLTEKIHREFTGLNLHQGRGVVLGNFHDLAVLQEECRSENKEKLNILFAGSIHREKGILELLTALADLTDVNFHLHICGVLRDQSIREEFDSLISQLGSRVTLHGYVWGQEKTSVFRESDVLVLPSFHEGFPLVVLEAMAEGCAIITTPVGATPEIMSDNKVLWVRIGNSDDIRTAIRKLAEDVELLIQMQQENRELSKRYTVERHIRELCCIYDGIQKEGQNETCYT